jgi:hypothetical protein
LHYFAVSCAIFLTAIIGCTNSTAPSGTTGMGSGNNVALKSESTQTRVTPSSIKSGGSEIQGGHGFFVDSLEVTSSRIFIKDIKLHHEENDSLDDEKDETIKVGPFIVIFDSSGDHLVTNTTIPPGTYDRIKFEIHKYDPGHDKHDDFDRDDSAKVFENPERYTFIITGWVWNGGVKSPFTYYSKVSANVTWRFPQNITLNKDSEKTLFLKLDPVFMFRVLGFALDPRDPDNHEIIDHAIQFALHIESK